MINKKICDAVSDTITGSKIFVNRGRHQNKNFARLISQYFGTECTKI